LTGGRRLGDRGGRGRRRDSGNDLGCNVRLGGRCVRALDAGEADDAKADDSGERDGAEHDLLLAARLERGRVQIVVCRALRVERVERDGTHGGRERRIDVRRGVLRDAVGLRDGDANGVIELGGASACTGGAVCVVSFASSRPAASPSGNHSFMP